MMNESTSDSLNDVPPSEASARRMVREVASNELLRGENEVLIRHGDELYRLKLTRNGKLILQK